MNPFIGEIRMMPFTFAPRDWAYCNGQLLPISQNQALYAIIGGTFGGDWRTTMGLPNLKARAPMGTGSGPALTPRTLGEATGWNSVTMVPGQLPTHDHTAKAALSASSAAGPTANQSFIGVTTRQGAGMIMSFGTPGTNDLAPAALAAAGGGVGHENRQPVLGLSFMMALDGIFPSRN